MYVMPNGPAVYVDIDDTLIMWSRPDDSTLESDKVIITTRGISDVFIINQHNVEYLKKLAIRGHAIVVWSAGGSCWAKSVIEALYLEKYVFAVLTKPTYFVDDIKNPKEFMGKHVYYDINGTRIGFTPNSLEEDK